MIPGVAALRGNPQNQCGLTTAVLLLAALAGCGGGEPPPPAGAETDAFTAWRARRREIPSAGFAETVRGSIEVLPPPAERIRRPDDFCEIWLNGSRLHRLRLAPLADGSLPSCRLDVVLRTGPNWVDFWDSTSNRGRREQIDTREGTSLSFSPSSEGYDFAQEKTE